MDATILYSSEKNSIILQYSDNKIEFFGNLDLWESYTSMMLWLEKNNLHLFLMGCRVDVSASGFLRSSSNGLLAYLHYIGQRTSSDDVVNVFDVSRDNIGTLDEKRKFYESWKDFFRKEAGNNS